MLATGLIDTDTNYVHAASQSVDEAWWNLYFARVEDWSGPGSDKAELFRTQLMLRLSEVQERLNDLYSIAVLREQIQDAIVMGGL